jgi:hydroxymethylbilane synthase
VRGMRHAPSELETTAERAFLQGLGGGCAVPVAARARVGKDGWLTIKGRVLSPDGSVKVEVEAREPVALEVGGLQAAYDVGLRLAAEALAQGAAELLGDSTGQAGA